MLCHLPAQADIFILPQAARLCQTLEIYNAGKAGAGPPKSGDQMCEPTLPLPLKKLVSGGLLMSVWHCARVRDSGDRVS